MTYCANGLPGVPKAGSPAAGFVVGETLTALVAEVLALPEVWAAMIAYAAGYTFTTVNLCGTDPPVMPSFTAADLFAILTGSAVESPASFQKLNDLITIAAWHQFCQCSSGATPSPPAAPAFPSGGPTVNPPGPPQTTVPCYSLQTWFETNSFDSSCNFTSAMWTSQVIKPGSTYIDVGLASFVFAGTPGYPLTYTMKFSAPDGSLLQTSTWSQTADIPGATPQHLYFAVPVGAHSITVQCHASSCSGLTQEWETTFDVYCGQMPGATVQPCCAPDDTLLAQLQQIQNLLNTLIQSQPTLVPSLADATVHSGLTGNGTVTIAADALAFRVNITTDLPGGRIDLGSPNYLFDRGYVVQIANSTPIRDFTRIVYNPQVFLLHHLTDQIGYTLPPGEVVTITELTRGP